MRSSFNCIHDNSYGGIYVPDEVKLCKAADFYHSSETWVISQRVCPVVPLQTLLSFSLFFSLLFTVDICHFSHKISKNNKNFSSKVLVPVTSQWHYSSALPSPWRQKSPWQVCVSVMEVWDTHSTGGLMSSAFVSKKHSTSSLWEIWGGSRTRACRGEHTRKL